MADTSVTSPGDVGPADPPGSVPPAGRGRPARRGMAWAVPVVALAVIFVAFSLPPYLTGDPALSRVPTRPHLWWYYPLLVAHIGFGSIALLAGAFQIWPWFRERHPVAHRWMGRAYFFAGVLPAGLAVLVIAPMTSSGLVAQAGNTMLALLWLPISIAGYRMARQRRFREHRRWMIRSFALTASIVVNRVWGAVLLIVFSPHTLETEAPAGALLAPDDVTGMAAVGVSTWLSWIVNLLIAEWWLERTDIARGNRARRLTRTAAGAPPGARTARSGNRRAEVPV